VTGRPERSTCSSPLDQKATEGSRQWQKGQWPFNIFCSAASRVRTKKRPGVQKNVKCFDYRRLISCTSLLGFVKYLLRFLFNTRADLQQLPYQMTRANLRRCRVTSVAITIEGEKTNWPTTLDGSCGYRRFRASSPYSLGKKKGQLKNKSQVGRFLSHDIEAGATSFQLLAYFFQKNIIWGKPGTMLISSMALMFFFVLPDISNGVREVSDFKECRCRTSQGKY